MVELGGNHRNSFANVRHTKVLRDVMLKLVVSNCQCLFDAPNTIREEK